jgi:outer membrane murein-binding lipoprotein Lpp
MKKITTLLSVAALVTTLGLAGCKKDKKNEEAAAPPKTEEPKTDTPKTDTPKTDTPAAGSADQAKTDTPPAAGGSTGMPECDAYLASVEKLASCDKFPAASKDATLKGVEAMKSGWAAATTDDAKKMAGDACKTANDGMKQTAQAMGCPL